MFPPPKYQMCYFLFLPVAAVHREGFSGGEHGEDPEEEAGPAGEGIRLHKHRQESVSY